PFDEPSTRQAHELIAEWSGGGSVLVVLDEAQARVALSFRNLRNVVVLPAGDVGVADLVGAASLLISEDALDQLTRRANGEKAGDAPAEPAAPEADAPAAEAADEPATDDEPAEEDA